MADRLVEVGVGLCVTLAIQNHITEAVQLVKGCTLGSVVSIEEVDPADSGEESDCQVASVLNSNKTSRTQAL